MSRQPLIDVASLVLVVLVGGCSNSPGTASGTSSGGSVAATSTDSVAASSTSGAPSSSSSGAAGGSSSAAVTSGASASGATSGSAGSSGAPSSSSSSGGIVDPCGLPGSWVHDASGYHEVAGSDAGLPSLAWLSIPTGYCAHEYGHVPNVRQIRFAPGGELFAASPSRAVASGVIGGLGAVVVLPDDNGDGVADGVLTYNSKLGNTQGLLFANGSFYYQDKDGSGYPAGIWVEPYALHQRSDPGGATMVADITVYESSDHWPKTLDIADDGTIYVGNGGDQGQQCQEPMPFTGGVLSIGAAAEGEQVAMGFRNPIAIRCHHDGQDHCFAIELSLDGSELSGGREKLVPIRSGDNWGFPCCLATGVPSPNALGFCGDGGSCSPNCSGVATDSDSFQIGNTPFGFDFDDTQFPPPWDHHVFIALHGEVGSWVGARVVAIELDATTGLPLAASDIDGGVDEGGMSDFATGWDNAQKQHGRPAGIAFSGDGRMFVSNDETGEIFWIAPLAMVPDAG